LIPIAIRRTSVDEDECLYCKDRSTGLGHKYLQETSSGDFDLEGDTIEVSIKTDEGNYFSPQYVYSTLKVKYCPMCGREL
jgi:hypothetical protein